jgi:hypothetical protein
MTTNSTHLESNPAYNRGKALKALELAKALEKEQLKNGKKYQRINDKTIGLL